MLWCNHIARVSNHYLVHLKFTHCCVSILSRETRGGWEAHVLEPNYQVGVNSATNQPCNIRQVISSLYASDSLFVKLRLNNQFYIVIRNKQFNIWRMLRTPSWWQLHCYHHYQKLSDSIDILVKTGCFFQLLWPLLEWWQKMDYNNQDHV